ncbi:MAG: hypothetical protein WA058_03850 [Minisyncoccia bacterium]
METQNSTKYFLWIIGGGILIGAIGTIYVDPYLPASVSNYQKGFATAKNLVENSSFGDLFKTPADVRTLSGTVTAINGNQLALHVQSNPFDNPTLADRTVLISVSTEVVNFVLKNPATYQAELASFTKSGQSGTPPQPFTQVAASASNIKVNDTIMVIATENIKTLKEFTASKIQFQTSMSSVK